MSRVEHYGPWVAACIIFAGLALFAASLGYTTYQNHKRIDENAQTAFALCDAAAGARSFWIGVRRTTRELLQDPELSAIERSSNEHFVAQLDKVIAAAHDIAHSCDGRE